MKNTPKMIVVHCTDYSYKLMADQFAACDGWHRDRWNQMILKNGTWIPAVEGNILGSQHRYMTDSESKMYGTVSTVGYYIGYHRLITGDHNYQARLDADEGAHCNQVVDGLSVNFQSLGVCVGFDGDVEMPTPVQYQLLKAQVLAWQDQYGIPSSKVFFHRHFATDKTCPGSLITDKWLADLLGRPAPDPKPNACVAQEQKIAELTQRLTWYDKLVSALMRLVPNK